MGAKGTLILKHQVEAYLFGEGEGAATRVEVSRQTANPIVDASATRPTDSPGRAIDSTAGAQTDKGAAYRNESSEFCAAINTGGQVRCGPEKAMRSAIACLTANKAAEQKARLVIAGE